MSDTVELKVDRFATGGDGVGRLADGCAVFVPAALPGERIRAVVTERKKRFARAELVEIMEPAAERIDRRCPHATAACGGCDWMHVAPDAQRRYKQQLVVEQLERLGGLAEPDVTHSATPRGTRTTVRCAVQDGRLGYRSRGAHDRFAADECSAAHPLIEELIVGARFPYADEVTLRVGAATGMRLAIVEGSIEAALVPDDVVVVSTDDVGDAAIEEIVAGQTWRISARSFFQTSREGAEALVGEVARRLADTDGPVVDLYAGVGLLGGAAVGSRLATSVEQAGPSSDDARHNLHSNVDVVRSRVERWTPTAHQAVIADPARRGLGAQGVATIERIEADQLVLVSCDPAALGRDTGLLGEQGWQFRGSTVVDMFPDTSRIEVVSHFDR